MRLVSTKPNTSNPFMKSCVIFSVELSSIFVMKVLRQYLPSLKLPFNGQTKWSRFRRFVRLNIIPVHQRLDMIIPVVLVLTVVVS